MSTTQLNMWDAWPVEATIGQSSDPDGLRSYQEAAVEAGARELKIVRATMFVMATGSGKTRTATAFIRRWLNGSITF